MRKILALLLICTLLAGCGAPEVPGSTETPVGETQTGHTSRYDKETVILLSDSGLDVSGPNSLHVYVSDDIIYYEDRDSYDSGNPYGEGELHERHSAEEAKNHVVVNITAPGTYRVSGKLSAGQLRVDLGDDAYEDPNAVVELILEGADITCTVAPAILFLNVYECDGEWDKDTAGPDVDTSAAGANLILAGENRVSGSHVAKIFKDKKGEKKLWKQDAAIYSYMSMNISGPGALSLIADNEGIGTQLHLTVNSGDICIYSQNDGINTNEDDVSVTTVNGGNLHVLAGLGEEGDGIDSNGYLVINGGTVISWANPVSDAGLDSDLGSFINGGTVIALGGAMDWAETDSGQVAMNLQFDGYRQGSIRILRQDGSEVFAYDPREDAAVGGDTKYYRGAILSCGDFAQGETYHVYVADEQMAYTGTDAMEHGPGRPQGQAGGPPPGGQQPPDRPQGGDPHRGGQSGGEQKRDFYMQDMVNFFSGLTEAE